jgi:hypothetical protein
VTIPGELPEGLRPGDVVTLIGPDGALLARFEVLDVEDDGYVLRPVEDQP